MSDLVVAIRVYQWCGMQRLMVATRRKMKTCLCCKLVSVRRFVMTVPIKHLVVLRHHLGPAVKSGPFSRLRLVTVNEVNRRFRAKTADRLVARW